MPYYLLHSYADLARAQASYYDEYPGARYPGFNHNFALLSLNAAIVEGNLRSILHYHLFVEDEAAKKQGIKNGQAGPSLPERTLTRFRIDVDTVWTWDKLKEGFRFVFDKPLGTLCSTQVLEAIDHLFTIRNRAAHGSSIQLPKEKLVAEDDEYLYTLQNKLQKLTDYMKAKFGVQDLYEGLGHRNTAEEFWKTTKQFFGELEHLAQQPPPLKKNIDAIHNYEFGGPFRG